MSPDLSVVSSVACRGLSGTTLGSDWPQKTFGTFSAKPQYRPDPKNHSRSRLIGPPTLTLVSHILSSPPDVGLNPFARSASSMFWLWNLLIAYVSRNSYANLLPPVRGIIFTETPAAWFSALPPDTVYDISSNAASLW